MYWQDLNDGHIKKYWKHGRAWFGKFGVCWCLPSDFLAFSFGVNGGDSNDQLTFFFGCGLFAIWLHYHFYSFHFGHLSNFSDEKFFIHEERQFKISYYEGSLWLDIWRDPMGGYSKTMPFYQKTHSFNFADFLLGRNTYSEKVVEKGECLIPMPEGCYPATYNLRVDTWKRPRWFKKEVMRIEIKCNKGIPHEGKGENIWDCGEDAFYGTNCIAGTLEEGIGKFVEICMRERWKYGGKKHLHRDKKAVMAQ